MFFRVIRIGLASFVKQNKIIGDDFCGSFFIVVPVFPIPGFQMAFYINQAAFVQIFLSQLCKAAP